MKQYLETATQQQPQLQQQQQTSSQNCSSDGEINEQLPEKGSARSLLAKWKSIENLKDKDTSPESGSTNSSTKQTAPVNNVVTDADSLPSGIAKNLLNKWQNIDRDGKEYHERKSSSPVNSINGQQQQQLNGGNDDCQIEKGFAKNVLAK
jgi:hypothetical protein